MSWQSLLHDDPVPWLLERGDPVWLALGVGLDNPKARRLYERLGYGDWGHGTVVGTWVEYPDDGPPVTLSETWSVLVKRL